MYILERFIVITTKGSKLALALKFGFLFEYLQAAYVWIYLHLLKTRLNASGGFKQQVLVAHFLDLHAFVPVCHNHRNTNGRKALNFLAFSSIILWGPLVKLDIEYFCSLGTC
jgi:hypothetical protein